MPKFVISTSDYMGEPPSLEIVSFPTQHDFLVDLLDTDSMLGEPGDDEDEDEYEDDFSSMTDEQLIAKYEQSNGDGMPYVMVINCDTEEVIIGDYNDE